MNSLSFGRVDAVGAAGASAVLALATVIGFLPVWNGRHAVARDRALASENDRLASDSLRDTQDLEARLGVMQAQLDANPVKLSAVEDLNQRLSDFVRLADEVGLALDQVEPGAPFRSPKFTTVPIKVSGTGTYAGLATFFEKLHSTRVDTSIEAFSINVASGDGDATKARFALQVVWYAAPFDKSVVLNAPSGAAASNPPRKASASQTPGTGAPDPAVGDERNGPAGSTGDRHN